MRVAKEHREVAKKLLDLFGPKGEHWTKGAFARTKSGRKTSCHSKNAYSYCMMGGMCHLEAYDTMDFLENSLPDGGIDNPIVALNDADGFGPVKKLLTNMAAGKIDK